MYNTRGMMETNAGLAWTILILVFGILILHIIATWKMFEKAGKPGWAAIIPIYATVILVQISEKPTWWIAVILLGGLVPVVGPFVQLAGTIVVGIGVAEKFGKSQGFGVGLGLLAFVFRSIIAFGDAEYQGEGAKAAAGSDEILDA